MQCPAPAERCCNGRKSQRRQDFATSGADVNVERGGAPTVYLSVNPVESRAFAILKGAFDVQAYRGRQVRVTGFIETEDVSGGVSLWAGLDPARGASPLATSHMVSGMMHGTNGWTPFSVLVDVPITGHSAHLDVLLKGRGAVWLGGLGVRVLSR